MANTMILLGTVTVGSGGSSSINFTSIPNTYTDLLLKGSLRFSDIAGVSQAASIKFNTLDTNQTWVQVYGTGTGVGSNGSTGLGQAATSNGSASTSNTFSNFQIYVSSYASSEYKIASTDTIVENNGTASSQVFASTTWSSTSPITGLSLVPNTTGNFAENSTAYLYGISKSQGEIK